LPTKKGGNKRATPTILGGTPAERKVPRRARPFPEIIDEQDWEVREGRYPSYIKRKARDDEENIMQVPLGATNIDRKIRLHEQAHVAWTPEIDEDEHWQVGELYEIETLNATEDARIIHLMNRKSEEWKEINENEVGLLTPQMQSAFQDGFGRLAAHLRGEKEAKEKGVAAPKAPEKMMNLTEAARLLASTRGYAEGHIFDQIAESADLGWVKKKVEKMHKHYIGDKAEPTFEDSLEYALELEEYFLSKQDEIEEMNAALAEAGEEMESMSRRYYGDAEADAKPIYTPPTLEKKGNSKPQPVKDPMGTTPKRIPGGSRWGQLTIVHKPLTEKLAARHARRPRPTDLGAVPRYMHRLLTDQRVFGRRRKKKAYEGTVLIDCSGSMRLTQGMVDEIIRRWPAVTVATYAGQHEVGQLWIVASKGKRASRDNIKPPGGGNVVDGPCLDWLAKQRMPRVWISDGGVTGIQYGPSVNFIKDAALKMKRGKIKRLGNAQALLGGYGTEEWHNQAEYL
jgi:hypothetical protein